MYIFLILSRHSKAFYYNKVQKSSNINKFYNVNDDLDFIFINSFIHQSIE
jgi:hypothetical protein